jgi:hypothetical protein
MGQDKSSEISYIEDVRKNIISKLTDKPDENIIIILRVSGKFSIQHFPYTINLMTITQNLLHIATDLRNSRRDPTAQRDTFVPILF